MTKLSRILERSDYNKLMFECPGCRMYHAINVSDDTEPRWVWNGDVEKPTFDPSILVCYPLGNPSINHICHSFVVNGRIQFLNDCTHALAGLTVDIPELDSQ